MALVEVDNLVKHFPVRGGFLNGVVGKVHAVNGVSFRIERGETVGVVGESGCGKTTLGRMLVRLIEPTAGRIRFEDRDITTLGHRAMMPLRQRLQIVFQDPYSALNPRLTSERMLREVLRFHNIVPREEEDARIDTLLGQVGLRSDARSKYPHEFSGGQRQRLNIARALALNPHFIVADEPVSALDVSVRAEILNLLMDLKAKYDLTLLFISHDLKVIEHFCDRMLVMYLGHVVEEMPCLDVEQRALHPYTKALLGANPVDDPAQRHELTVLEGDVPSPYNPPQGCPFVTRCPTAVPRCHEEMPPLTERAPGHRVACWEEPNRNDEMRNPKSETNPKVE